MDWKISRQIFILTALLALTGSVAWAAGGSSASTTAQDPGVEAKEAYNRALRYRDKAWEYEKRMEGAAADEREKLQKKAEKEYQKAIRALRSAVEADPALYQAHSSLGYALRKTGEYEESLAAYDRALELNPAYTEAIEYRAEAYLGLGRLEEAKEAYMTLLRTDRERADELLAAMRGWVEMHRDDPGKLDAATVDAFAGWVEERSAVAEQAALAPRGDTDSWRRPGR